MKVLGITGGVGAGKSTVLTYLFEKYQARVIQADQAAHFLEQPGQKCFERIVELFGRDILDEKGIIDRKKLGEMVFRDSESLKRLNGVVHPAVKAYIMEEIQREREAGRAPFLVIEAALLLEDHYDEICDEIWYVHTDRNVRIRRLMESRGYSEEKSEEIMRNQLPDELFFEQCQFVVDNSSDFIENTYEQIDRGLVEHEFM